jgi:hypothetical protein
MNARVLQNQFVRLAVAPQLLNVFLYAFNLLFAVLGGPRGLL